MNVFLWVLQGLGALLYLASGVMKSFFFDKVSEGVPSFGAMPRGVWNVLGIFEIVCAVGLVAPTGLHWHAGLTVVAASALAVESLIFIWVHVRYKEPGTIVMSAVLGLLMAFVAYGRGALAPLF